MSELHGFFALRTPEDLLRKLEADWERLRAVDPVSQAAQYAAFDFFVTANHIPDWLREAGGGKLSEYRNYPDGALVTHIGTGAKHFRGTRLAEKPASGTRVYHGVFDSNGFDAAVFEVSQLVIDLEDGTTVPVLAVAERVITHWRAQLEPEPGG